MISKILARLGLKQSAANRSILAWMTPGQPIWTPVDYAHLSREGYARNVVVYRCVEYVAAACAGIEWDLYLKTQRDAREREQHPLLDLFERPNEFQAGSDLIRSLVSYRLLSGNAYLESVHPDQNVDQPAKPVSKPPRELFALRPDRMTVIPGDEVNPIYGYRYSCNGRDVDYPRQKVSGRWSYRVLHWKTFNPLHDFYGMSPIEAAARTIDQNNESRAWNVALLQNSARPPLLLTSKESLTDQQYERLKQFVDENYMGSRNAGRPLLAELVDAKEIGQTPVEMAWIEGLRLSTREICSAFGVPPELVGDSANKTYSNYQETRKAFYEETVLPLLDSLRDALNAWLTPQYGERLRLDYNRDDIEALQEDRDKLWMRLEKVSFISDNEKREACGYEPYAGPGSEEADKLCKPVNSIPIDSFSKFESTTPPDAQAADNSGAKGTKALDLSTTEAKAAYWQGFERQRSVFYGWAEKQVRQQLLDDMEAVAAAAEAGASMPDGALAALHGQRGKWADLIERLYLQVGGTFARRVDEAISEALDGKSAKAYTGDAYLRGLQQYIIDHSADRIEHISQTTKDEMKESLLTGIDRNETVPQIAKRLRRDFPELTRDRALTIARTEIIAASNAGSQAAARARGLPLEKEWVATPDGRTRHQHAEANGQRRPVDEPYMIGGQQLMFPGDGSLGVTGSNLVNCRCAEVYHVV